MKPNLNLLLNIKVWRQGSKTFDLSHYLMLGLQARNRGRLRRYSVSINSITIAFCPSFFPLYIYFHMIQSCHFHFLSILPCMVTLYLRNTYYLMSRYYKNKSLISLLASSIYLTPLIPLQCALLSRFLLFGLYKVSVASEKSLQVFNNSCTV